MASRFAVLILAVFLAAVGVDRTGQVQPHDSPMPGPCEPVVAAGQFVQPPQVEVGTLPLDDLGRRELVLTVVHDGPRYCFHYMWNGRPQIVAPTLLTHRGERFAIRLVNEISAPAPGEAMKARALAPCMPAPMPAVPVRKFSGYLNHTIYERSMPMKPVDVNLHLHGFEGPPQEENVFLSTLSTPAHACEYDITIPATQPPGTYFYHPHAHGMSGPEVLGGLSGMWIVEPNPPLTAAIDERDILLRAQVPTAVYDAAQKRIELAEVSALMPAAGAHEGTLRVVPPLRAYDPFDPPAWPTYLPLRAGGQRLDPNGCGFIAEPTITVNGAATPLGISVPAGRPQLLRVLNATPNGMKYIRLRDAAGTAQMLHVVGRDGVPVSSDDAHPLANYVPMEGVLLGPTMRADILVTVKAGQSMTLYSDRRCMGPFGGALLRHDLLTISAASAADRALPADIPSVPLTPAHSRAAQLIRYARLHPGLVRRRALTYTQYEFPNANGKAVHFAFYITQTSDRDFHEQPYWPAFAPGQSTPIHADIVVKQGTVEEWYLFNATPEVHTFHIHQMAFAAEDEAPASVMLDTVVIPPGRMLPNPGDPNYALIEPSRTRILLDFRHVPRGEFVYHCHMLLHEDNGMMGVIRVI